MSDGAAAERLRLSERGLDAIPIMMMKYQKTLRTDWLKTVRDLLRTPKTFTLLTARFGSQCRHAKEKTDKIQGLTRLAGWMKCKFADHVHTRLEVWIQSKDDHRSPLPSPTVRMQYEQEEPMARKCTTIKNISMIEKIYTSREVLKLLTGFSQCLVRAFEEFNMTLRNSMWKGLADPPLTILQR